MPLELDDIRKYRADPGDVVIYKTRYCCTEQHEARIRALHHATFGPNIKALILDNTIDLTVIEGITT